MKSRCPSPLDDGGCCSRVIRKDCAECETLPGAHGAVNDTSSSCYAVTPTRLRELSNSLTQFSGRRRRHDG